jgi:hypothetical protein
VQPAVAGMHKIGEGSGILCTQGTSLRDHHIGVIQVRRHSVTEFQPQVLSAFQVRCQGIEPPISRKIHA